MTAAGNRFRGPMRRAEKGLTNSTETLFMDLYDAGNSPRDIAAITGEPFAKVDRVLGYMREGASDDLNKPARIGSAALLAAIARHHPERIRA